MGAQRIAHHRQVAAGASLQLVVLYQIQYKLMLPRPLGLLLQRSRRKPTHGGAQTGLLPRGFLRVGLAATTEF